MTAEMAPPKMTLDADDLALVVEIARKAKEMSGVAVATVRGPETKDALAPYMNTEGWEKLPRIGSWWFQRPRGTAVSSAPDRVMLTGDAARAPNFERGSTKCHKRLDVMWAGSEKYQRGIPVGVTERHTQRVMFVVNDHKHTQDVYDFWWTERNLIESIVQGKKWMSERQVKDHTEKMEALRSADHEAKVDPSGTLAKNLVAAMKGAGILPGAPAPVAVYPGDFTAEELEAAAAALRTLKAKKTDGK